MRVAVIGTGIGGLVTLYTIQKKLIESGKFDGELEVVAFERADAIGGEWILSAEDKPETFDQGLPMMSSVYRGLRTNVPNPVTELHPDFPWPLNTRAYPTQEEFLAYIQSFCKTFNLTRYIRFSKSVYNIKRESESSCFLVDVKDLKSGEIAVEKFDYVFVCTGQHRKPYMPPEDDTSQFTGTIMHYHDMKDPDRLIGKRVLVVGSVFGALDIATVLLGRAKEVSVSYAHHKPFWLGDKLKDCCHLKPKLAKASGNTVFFVDDSSLEVDVIIYATGFLQVHPLSPELQLDFNASSCLFPLYKHIVHPSCSSMFFIGKSYAYIIQLARSQAEFACAIIDGRVQLPSKEEMLADNRNFQAKWLPEIIKMFDEDLTNYFPIGELEIELASHYASSSGCEPFDPYVRGSHYACLRAIKADARNYRRYRLVDRKDVDSTLGNYFVPSDD